MSDSRQIAEKNGLLERALLMVLRLPRKSEDPSVDAVLESLGKALADQCDVESLEIILGELKSELIKSQLGQPSPDSAMDDSNDKPGEGGEEQSYYAALLEEAKNTCRDIIKVLDVDLSPEYSTKIAEIRLQMDRADTLEAFFAKRKALEALVREYARHTSEERDKAANFIAEVANKLSELETYLKSTIAHFQANHRSNAEFSSRLENEVGRTATSVRDAKDLDRLKEMVLSKLSHIGELVKNKQKHDAVGARAAGEDIRSFRAYLHEIQDEVTRVHKENQSLVRRLRHDWLTGSFNRMAYDEFLSHEMSRFRRYGRGFSMILFDLDNFKALNDNHGHSIGDRCLQEVVRNIKPVLRENDILARYGGDEFVIVLPEADLEAALKVAEKVRQSIENIDFMLRGQKVALTISLGVTEALPTDSDKEMIAYRADKALYQAKKRGRNRVVSSTELV